MKFILHILFVLSAVYSTAQVDSLLYEREQELKLRLDKLRAAKKDAEKETANEDFKSYLSETIRLKGAVDYPFSNLKTLGSIKSPDNSFRLFNWNVEQEDQSNKYYCYVLRFDEKKKNWISIELKDNSIALPSRPDDILNEENWYGALYYRIIPIEKSNKTLYTVLGWDGNNPASNIKLIDVISFSGNHVKFGSPVFKMQDGVHKRLYFEHSKRAFMSLNYDDERKRIVYDHLSPESPGMEGFYEYYVPDLSYDELKFQNNKWVLYENVISVNQKNTKSASISHLNPKDLNSGQNKTEKIKGNWVDPSDPNAPGGANIHVAKMPGEEIENPEKTTQSEEMTPKISKRKNRKNEFSMNPFLKKKH